MTERARRFRLGLFALSGLLLLVTGILVIGAGRVFRRTEPLYCYFAESVQGLDRGMPVKFRGVEVGRVEEINVMPSARIAAVTDAPHDASLIEVRSSLFVDKISDQTTGVTDGGQIRTSIAREVRQGLRVRIAWKDITGQKFLDLDYAAGPGAPAPTLPFDPPGIWIPTAMERSISDIQRDVATVTSELAQVEYRAIANDLRALITALKARIDELGSTELVRKFGDAASAVTALATNPKIDEALTRLNATLEHTGSATARLDALLAKPELDTAVADAAAGAGSFRRIAEKLETDLPRITASAEETLALARRTIEESRLAATTEAARATLSDVGAAARQMSALRDAARRTLTDLGGASRGLAQLVRFLEENPDALVHGKTEEVR